MHYRVDGSHLPAKLVQRAHAGWVGVAFSQAPGVMLGATAIIGSPGAVPPKIERYFLGSKSPSGVVPMAAAVQTLVGTAIDTAGGSVAITFSLPLGSVERGLLLKSDGTLAAKTHLIFAHGTSAQGPGWHTASGGMTISLGHLDPPSAPPPAPSLPPPPITLPPSQPPPIGPHQLRILIVTVTFTIDVTVTVIDEAAFKTALAAALGVLLSEISLTVVTGSRRVRRLQSATQITAAITYTSDAAAVAGTTELTRYESDPQAASAALGVAVTGVSSPTTMETFVTKPPPNSPGPSLPPASVEGDAQNVEGGGALNASILGLLLGAVAFIALIAVYVYMNRKRRRSQQPVTIYQPEEGADKGTSATTEKPKSGKRALRAKEPKEARGSVWLSIGEASSKTDEGIEASISMKVSSAKPPAPPLGPPPELPPITER